MEPLACERTPPEITPCPILHETAAFVKGPGCLTKRRFTTTSGCRQGCERQGAVSRETCVQYSEGNGYAHPCALSTNSLHQAQEAERVQEHRPLCVMLVVPPHEIRLNARRRFRFQFRTVTFDTSLKKGDRAQVFGVKVPKSIPALQYRRSSSGTNAAQLCVSERGGTLDHGERRPTIPRCGPRVLIQLWASSLVGVRVRPLSRQASWLFTARHSSTIWKTSSAVISSDVASASLFNYSLAGGVLCSSVVQHKIVGHLLI